MLRPPRGGQVAVAVGVGAKCGAEEAAVLDVTVERIAGNPVPTVHLAMEGLGQMGHALREIYRLFRSAS